MARSIAADQSEDGQIVGGIPCHLGKELGLDVSDPAQRELLLEQLRSRFRGKTVAQVAAEVRAQRKAESDKAQKFAEELVRADQEKWKNRVGHLSLVTVGSKTEDVLKYLGNPDVKSDSNTTKNWLYWVSASVKDGQICKDYVYLKIEDGVVVNLQRTTGSRQAIADAYKESHN